MDQRWSQAELEAALGRYESELVAAMLLPNAVQTYVGYSARFLRWRKGEYRPRTAFGPGPAQPPRVASADELRREIDAYETDLRKASLASAAVNTYVDHPRRFTRWLEGRFKTARPRRTSSPHTQMIAAPKSTGEAQPPADAAPDWAWEGNVQAALVAWLAADGWTIDREADTKAGDHGVDILARRNGERLAIEVKGYPQATYARGVNAGQPKRWHPGAQARTYFGTGLHAAIITRDRSTDAQAALALPDVPTYRSLLDQVRASLRDLGIRAFLVSQDGGVRELRR